MTSCYLIIIIEYTVMIRILIKHISHFRTFVLCKRIYFFSIFSDRCIINQRLYIIQVFLRLNNSVNQ